MEIDITTLERDTQQKYHFEKLIGIGTFGMVFQATNRRTKSPVAVKKVRNVFENVTQAKRILREIRLLSKLNHTNITNLIDVCATRSYESFNDVYLVIDLMESDLETLIRTEKFNVEHRKSVVYQIAKALKYLHSANVIHRDLKPENILVNSKNEIKVSDFGLARVIDDPYDLDLQTEAILTRWYRAPEVLLNMKNLGSPIDIWSLGCILAEMMLGKVLFPGQSNVNMLTLIVELLGSPTKEDFQQIVNSKARTFMDSLPKQNENFRIFQAFDPIEVDLLKRMLTWNPEKRINIEDILRHEYLKAFHDPFEEPVTVGLPKFEFEGEDITMEQLKQSIWKEIHFPK